MSVYLIIYDLNKDEKNYPGLITAIKAYGRYCKPQKSAWFIDTTQSATQVRDNLSKEIDEDDDLFVGDLGEDWAGSTGMKCVDWLNKPRRSWTS